MVIKMKMKKLLFVALGCASLGLGCVGIVLPILPTVPFFLLTAYCFARSSQRLHDWFLGTGLYKKHLAGYVEKRGMTVRTKATLLATVTLVMGVGFAMMGNVPVGRAVLAVVWAAHLLYVLLRVKTLRPEKAGEN